MAFFLYGRQGFTMDCQGFIGFVHNVLVVIGAAAVIQRQTIKVVIHVLCADGKPRAVTIAAEEGGDYAIGSMIQPWIDQAVAETVKQLGVKESRVIAFWATVLKDEEHTRPWYDHEFRMIDPRMYAERWRDHDFMKCAVEEYRAEMERRAEEVYATRLRLERIVQFIQNGPVRKAVTRWRRFVNDPRMLGCKNRLLREFQELLRQTSFAR